LDLGHQYTSTNRSLLGWMNNNSCLPGILGQLN
jgi:hypothetical protein